MAIRLGQPLPDDRIDAIFAAMDKNKDGRIQADEFMEWFEKEETMVKSLVAPISLHSHACITLNIIRSLLLFSGGYQGLLPQEDIPNI